MSEHLRPVAQPAPIGRPSVAGPLGSGRSPQDAQRQPAFAGQLAPSDPNPFANRSATAPSVSSFPCRFENSSRPTSRLYPMDMPGDYPFVRNRRIKFHDRREVKTRHRPHPGDVAIGPCGRLINPYNIFPYVYYVKPPHHHRRHHRRHH